MKKVTVIGGGTGTYTILRGLKNYNIDITAIVSMSDNGGSTGILRDEFGILPPGDIRKCIVALSESSEIMKKLFEYRFNKGFINGHSLGNLLLTALEDITGSYDNAIKYASKILNIKGNVIPVTLSNCQLHAILENGQVIKGETNIDIPKHNANIKIKNVYLNPESEANPEAIKKIKESDLIIIGPGDLYTSIIPNLLVKGITEAIKESKAKKVYVCNIMTKYGETNNFKLSDFIETIEQYLGKNVIDYVLANNGKLDKNILKMYEQEKSFPVDINKSSNKIILKDLVSRNNLARHDPEKTAKAILSEPFI
ncbi:YvcK family protein [Candidatus Woesearchaeota archaeon]|nr:MAG: YvcK family protein [Candidatus Woesearchaeota archaeon]